MDSLSAGSRYDKTKGRGYFVFTSSIGLGKNEVQQLNQKIADLEDEAFRMAKTDWSIEEIAEAKEKAKQR